MFFQDQLNIRTVKLSSKRTDHVFMRSFHTDSVFSKRISAIKLNKLKIYKCTNNVCLVKSRIETPSSINH